MHYLPENLSVVHHSCSINHSIEEIEMCLSKYLQHGLISHPSRWHSLLRLMNTLLHTYIYKRRCHSWSKPKEIILVNKMFHVYLSRSSTHTLIYCYCCIWIARGQASQQFDFCSGLTWGSLVRFYNWFHSCKRADGLIRESLCGWNSQILSLIFWFFVSDC